MRSRLASVLLVAVFALTGCITVNRGDNGSSQDSPESSAYESDLPSAFRGMTSDERFDKAYAMPEFDHRNSREETRHAAKKSCELIEESGSLSSAMSEAILGAEDLDSLDAGYLGTVFAIAVLSYCPQFASEMDSL